MGRKVLFRGLLITAVVAILLMSVSCAVMSKFFSTDLIVQVLHELYNEKDAGTTMEFRVSISGGSGPYTVKWYKGTVLVGEGNPFALESLKPSDSAFYWGVVTDKSVPAKVAVIPYAELVVVDGPRFVKDLVNAVVDAGDPFVFEVHVTGGRTPYTIKWYKDEVLFVPTSSDSRTAATFRHRIPSVLPTHAGWYQVEVKDADNKVADSTEVYLAVRTDSSGVSIDQHPQSQTKIVGETATFTVGISGGVAPIQYQWQTRNSAIWVDIAGANKATYTTPVQTLPKDQIHYRVIVTDATGVPEPSNPAVLTVLAAPDLNGNWVGNVVLESLAFPPWGNETLVFNAVNPVVVSGTGRTRRVAGIVDGQNAVFFIDLLREGSTWKFSTEDSVTVDLPAPLGVLKFNVKIEGYFNATLNRAEASVTVTGNGAHWFGQLVLTKQP